MNLSRTLAAAALSLTLLPSVEASTLKIATVAPDGTSWMKLMRASGDTIEERTEGRVQLKFYPGGVMGGAATVRRKMRVGQLHGGAFTGGDLADVYPDFYLYSLPFLFRSEDEVLEVRSELDELIAKGLEEQGLVLLGLAGGGFVYLMSDHQVTTLEDLAGSKVWVPEGDPVSHMALENAGVSPIPLPLPDVYTALQTGVVDTVLNTTVGSIAFQWHTRMNYLTDYPVAYVVGGLALDKRSFNRLSEGDRTIVREEIEATFDELSRVNRKDNAQAREALKNQGIEFQPVSEAQLPRWREIGRETLTDLRESDLELEHLDFLIQTLQDIRAGTRTAE